MMKEPPDRIFLDFGSTAIDNFKTRYTGTSTMICYFHITKSVMHNVNDIGMKVDYETNAI